MVSQAQPSSSLGEKLPAHLSSSFRFIFLALVLSVTPAKAEVIDGSRIMIIDGDTVGLLRGAAAMSSSGPKDRYGRTLAGRWLAVSW
jgi:hypothetical protein